jgi:hypothetical protein
MEAVIDKRFSLKRHRQVQTLATHGLGRRRSSTGSTRRRLPPDHTPAYNTGVQEQRIAQDPTVNNQKRAKKDASSLLLPLHSPMPPAHYRSARAEGATTTSPRPLPRPTRARLVLDLLLGPDLRRVAALPLALVGQRRNQETRTSTRAGVCSRTTHGGMYSRSWWREEGDGRSTCGRSACRTESVSSCSSSLTHHIETRHPRDAPPPRYVCRDAA